MVYISSVCGLHVKNLDWLVIVESFAKLLDNIAAPASILCGQAACRGLELTGPRPVSACPR